MKSAENTHGIISHSQDSPRRDYLFRVSLKAVILNAKGEVLIVKEHDRDWWDLPGGGMDHGESIKEALARELFEEVSYQGDFEYRTLLAEDPRYSNGFNLYQMRITFLVEPESFIFKAGEDGDKIAFVNPSQFENSVLITERLIFEYCQLATA